MLQRYDARITKMYHPIFQINRKNGNIVNIQNPKEGVELRSSIYLEFDISVSLVVEEELLLIVSKSVAVLSHPNAFCVT